ncbi:hypothetical protein ACAW74_26185 [Fibrella sp. WM1]
MVEKEDSVSQDGSTAGRFRAAADASDGHKIERVDLGTEAMVY